MMAERLAAPSAPFFTRIAARLIEDNAFVSLFAAAAFWSESAGLAVCLIGWATRAATTSMFGGTPLKRLFGMRVIDIRTGAHLPIWRSAVRESVTSLWLLAPVAPGGAWVALMLLAVVPVDILLFLVRHDRRTVHDFVAGSAVVSDSWDVMHTEAALQKTSLRSLRLALSPAASAPP